jgi:hypothetical protein
MGTQHLECCNAGFEWPIASVIGKGFRRAVVLFDVIDNIAIVKWGSFFNLECSNFLQMLLPRFEHQCLVGIDR